MIRSTSRKFLCPFWPESNLSTMTEEPQTPDAQLWLAAFLGTSRGQKGGTRKIKDVSFYVGGNKKATKKLPKTSSVLTISGEAEQKEQKRNEKDILAYIGPNHCRENVSDNVSQLSLFVQMCKEENNEYRRMIFLARSTKRNVATPISSMIGARGVDKVGK